LIEVIGLTVLLGWVVCFSLDWSSRLEILTSHVQSEYNAKAPGYRRPGAGAEVKRNESAAARQLKLV